MMHLTSRNTSGLIKSIATFLLVFSAVSSFAQRQNIYFLKNDGRFVSSKDSADYIRIVSEPDSGTVLYNVADFYKNGKRKLVGKSATIESFKPEGIVISYYNNGNRKAVNNYANGLLNGECIEYYPNGKVYTIKKHREGNNVGIGRVTEHDIMACRDSTGKILAADGNGYYVGYDDDFKYIAEEGNIKNGKYDGTWKGEDKLIKVKFTEHYESGVMKKGESTDSLGIIRTYQNRIVHPQFKGGMQGLYKYLANNLHYPNEARRDDISGTVILKFVVKKDGTLKDIAVFKSVHNLLDKEAIRVLSKTDEWIPGYKCGLLVNVKFMLPVKFALQ
ncbi:hypothetical protein GCM10023149_27590 [Mucilaginibacter gynuensis]|uniref:TonB C-terminal domain-containing protein n=1 Tax=Mucilaginibacter gynuensis TaxID=1302236 RepID=A0ABP8GJA8_9SPHI